MKTKFALIGIIFEQKKKKIFVNDRWRYVEWKEKSMFFKLTKREKGTWILERNVALFGTKKMSSN